jgi:hypothetical protein
MFDVPSSAQRGRKLVPTPTPTPSIPSIIVNIPDAMASHHLPYRSLHRSRSPHIASDPADYYNELWPSLHKFLLSVQSKDRHNRDLMSHEVMLREQEILGPDDIARCSVDELHQTCNIPIGTVKLLIAEGQHVSEAVKSDARAQKCQRVI